MDLNHLTKITAKSKKRIGRGAGSGRGGHTSTRGHKGQKARGAISLIFEGTKLKKSWVKRLPFIRGKGKLKSRQAPPFVIDTQRLSSYYKKGERVDIDSMRQKKILPEDFNPARRVKILHQGEVKVPLEVAVPCSQKAAKAMVSAGGKILVK